MGVENTGPGKFKSASEYLDFFLLLYGLVTQQPVIHFVGVGHPIQDLSELGKDRVSFSKFVRVDHLNPDIESVFTQPILKARKRFIDLEGDMRIIITNNHVGLALRYYLYAIQTS